MEITKAMLICIELYLLLLVSLTETTENKLGHFQSFSLNMILEGLKKMNSTTSCGLHINEYLHGLSSEKYWAQKMYDSSANTLHGIYMGNNKFIGHYDECLSVNHPEKLFEGQHCVLNIDILDEQHGLPILHMNNFKVEFHSRYYSMLYAICIPSTCKPKETEIALKKWFNETAENGSIYVKLDSHNCYSTTSVRSKEISRAVKNSLLIIGLLSLISTIYDFVQRYYYKIKQPYNLFLAFSIYTNSSYLFRDSATDLKVTQGLKGLASILVICSHSWQAVWVGPLENLRDGEEMAEKYGFINIHVVTEGIFFLSGFLIAESFCRESAKADPHNFFRSFITKYIRITILFSLIRLFNGWVFLNLGSGPIWNFFNKDEYESCKEGWISALLYSWNYVNPFQLCMRATWTINIHMHHLLLSPLVLIPLMRHPTWAHVYLATLISIAILISFAVNYTHKLLPFYIYGAPAYAVEIIPTHAKMTSWLIGILFGYKWDALCDEKLGVNLSKVTIGWIISWMCFLIGLIGSYPMTDDENVSYFQGALLLCLQKVFFVSWVAWILFACKKGFGGPIDAVLSSRLFQILAKISVWVFLIHPIILSYIIGTKKTNYIGSSEQINNLFTTIVFTVIVASLLKVFIEMPIIVISKYVQEKLKNISKPAIEKFKQEKKKTK